MNMAEWIDIGITNGVVDMPEIEEKTFEEIYKQWFKMKLNVIRAQSCDRIEVTYNRYYAGSWLVSSNISALDESAFVRLTGKWSGGMSPKERSFPITIRILLFQSKT